MAFVVTTVMIALIMSVQLAAASPAAVRGWDAHWGRLFVGIAMDINDTTGNAPVSQVQQHCDAAVADITAFKVGPPYPGVNPARWKTRVSYLSEEARICADTVRTHPADGFAASNAAVDLSGAFQELYDILPAARGDLGDVSPLHAKTAKRS